MGCMNVPIAGLALVVVLLAPHTVLGEDELPREYVAHYGDGIRAYTESRYDDALRELYRAYAIKQTSYALKLIIRSHDFLGNCSARERAAQMLGDTFSATAPAPQMCTHTGLLHIECTTEGNVRIDGKFDAVCGTTVRVPAGRHRVVSQRLGSAVLVDIPANETTVASIQPSPTKWYLGDAGPHKWSPNDPVADSELRRDPDMPRKFDVKRPTKPKTWGR